LFCGVRASDVVLVLGVDREGIIVARELAKRYAVPYGLVSFEIMFQEETSLEFKLPERHACRDIAFALVQDGLRARNLSEENLIPEEKMVLVPVGGHGVRRRPAQTSCKHAPEGKRVALYMGSLEPWTLVDEVLAGLGDWPDDWVLLLHERYGLTGDVARQFDIDGMLGTRLFISDSSYATIDDLAGLLHTVDLGLAFYKPTYEGRFVGRNIADIGLASGKIATYLQHGVPVAVNEIGEYAELVRNRKLGIVSPDPRNLGHQLADFNPDECREQCYACFAEILDLQNHFGTLQQAMLSADAGHLENSTSI